MASAGAAAADRAAMPPPPSRPGSKRKVVLEEDTFAEAIEAIIERDFFPALPKLQNQLEWLQAVQSGDPAQIKRAQLNIARRRAGLRTPLAHDGTGAPGTAALTPGTGLLRTPAMTPAVGAGSAAAVQAGATPARTPAGAAAAAALQQQGVDAVSAQQAVGAKAPSLGLDQFFTGYQGEDNASFQEIQKKSIERKRAKMVHHLQDKNTPLLLEAGGHSTDDFGTSGQAPSTVLSTKHVPKSALYYDSSQRQPLALTAAEQATIVQGPPKSINLAATRSICAGPLQEPLAAPPAAVAGSSNAVGAAPAADESAAAPGDGSLEQRQADRVAAAAVAPGTRGYGYMKTPQIVPGVDASPLMTWGDIASTPLRLDGMDADIEGLGVLGDDEGVPGRQFTMPQVRTREVAAQQMHASKSAAGKRRAAMGGGVAGGGSSGLAGRPGSATPLLDSLRRGSAGPTGQRSSTAGGTPVHGLSAAGLKLAKQLGKGSRPGTGPRAGSGAGGALAGSSADLQLRASYKGGSGAAATPVRAGAGSGAAGSSWDMTPGRAAAGSGSSSSRQLSGKVRVQAGSGVGGRSAAAKQQPAAGANVTDDLLKLS